MRCYSCHDKSVSRFKSELMREFEMTDLGVMNYFLGIEFHKSKVGLLMHQRRYALDIWKKCCTIRWIKFSDENTKFF